MNLDSVRKVVFSGFLFVLLSGCGSASISNPKTDTLVLATTNDPKTFNTILAKETSSTAITGFIFEGLTRTNGVTTEVEPGLAESWKVSDSGRTWDFKLRKTLWSDGKPVTADDVIFTFRDLIYNPDIPTSSRDVFMVSGREIKVEEVAEDRIRFTLPAPFAPFLRQLGQDILPAHRLRPALRSGRFNATWGVDARPSEIVGTGPFILSEYRIGEKVVLAANPYYYKKDKTGRSLPYLKRIVILIVPDQNAELLRFLQGEIDSISVRGQDYKLLKPQEAKRNFTIYNTGPALGENFLAFNQNSKAPISAYKSAWFRNRVFRRAISYGLDRESMTRNVYAGLAYPQWGPMNQSGGYFYNPKVKEYPYNPEESRRLLKDAGFQYRNGILYDSTGHRVEFTLLTNGDTSERVQMATLILDDLDKLGIKVHFLPVDFNNLVNRMVASYDWEAVILGLTGGIEPHGGRNVWHSSGQLHLWNPRQKEPDTVWEKEIDGIFEKAACELDNTKRKVLYDRWQMIVSEEVPVIYLVNPAALYAVRNRFGNLKPTGYGGVFYNIEDIYITTK
ncbi:MAG: ABC transporter substrate-binding protein [Candidatus Ratteibacteria bacterium]|jgi:peptide/nickel transport system substrate-binding protein